MVDMNSGRKPRPPETRESSEKLMGDFLNELISDAKTPKSPLLQSLILRSDGRGFPVSDDAMRIAQKLSRLEREASAQAKARYSSGTYERISMRALGDTISELRNGWAIPADSAGFLDMGQVLAFYRERRDAELAQAITDLHRHIPCHIFHNAELLTAFDVGPVTFFRRDVWAEKHIANKPVRSELLRLWSNATNRELSSALSETERRQVNAVLSAVKNYEWVGTTFVKNHDAENSHSEASILVGLALDCLSLALNAESGALLNRAGTQFSYGGPRLATTSEGQIVSGSTARLPGLGGHPDAANQFISDTATFRKSAGQILTAYVDARQNGTMAPWLVERWINALHWFGEARREPSDFMAIVKYGSALDILSGAGGKLTTMAQFVTAVVGVTQASDESGGSVTVTELVNRVFNDGRSALVHGEAFGLLTELSQQRARADRTVQEVIYSVTEPLGTIVSANDRMLTVDKDSQTRAFQIRLASRWNDISS
jgi:hypothetical protein